MKNINFKMKFLKTKNILLILVISLFVGGCRANVGPYQKLSTGSLPFSLKSSENSFWWRCKFKNIWPEDSAPDSAVDLLLAHAVAGPVLVKHINKIEFWRFHRRASDDEAGHQFSLIFYSEPEVASIIFSEINDSSVLKSAISENLVEKVITDDPSNPQFTGIEDTSDGNWSPDLQKNWPSFIMGVSSMWLGLIDDAFQGSIEDPVNASHLLEKYREAEEKITKIWNEEGQHAFLHHLNAIFGYEPLLFKKEMTF